MTKCMFCGKKTQEKHYGDYCCKTCYDYEEKENAYELLAEAGVPFFDGEPVGI